MKKLYYLIKKYLGKNQEHLFTKLQYIF